MDWNAFSYDHRIEFKPDVVGLIIKTEAYKEAALDLCLPPDWRDKLDKLNRVRAVYGTTALEGNPLSEAEVSQQMEDLEQKTEVKRGATREQLQIRNAGLAQEWVRNRFTPGSAPMRVEDILQMHSMITSVSDTKDNMPGRFRTHSVVVGTEELGGVHKGAPHSDLPRLMKEYIEFINSRKMMEQHAVIRALLAHFYLVTIHPFGDGNGRVSRLVEAGILFQGKYNVHGFYGLSNYFYSNEQEYKKTLQKCRATQPFDMTPFVIFGLNGFALELKGINNFIKTKLNRVVYRAMMVRAFNQHRGLRRRLINQREYNLLDFLLMETEPVDPFSDNPSREISHSELQRAPFIKASYSGVTRRTFIRELTRLAENGFIILTQDVKTKDFIVNLNFMAIGRY